MIFRPAGPFGQPRFFSISVALPCSSALLPRKTLVVKTGGYFLVHGVLRVNGEGGAAL